MARSRSCRGRTGRRHSCAGSPATVLAAPSGSWGHTWDLSEPVRMDSVALPGGTPVSHPGSGMELRRKVSCWWGPALPSLPAPRRHQHGSWGLGGTCVPGSPHGWPGPARDLACSSQDSDTMVSPADGGGSPGQEGGGVSRPHARGFGRMSLADPGWRRRGDLLPEGDPC